MFILISLCLSVCGAVALRVTFVQDQNNKLDVASSSVCGPAAELILSSQTEGSSVSRLQSPRERRNLMQRFIILVL